MTASRLGLDSGKSVTILGTAALCRPIEARDLHR